MSVIYTISHPLTDEIVYVGATKHLDTRIKSHYNSKQNNAIGEYVRSLKNQYLLPKIQEIDVCNSDELMYFEKYWIAQMTAWGYRLLNKHVRTKPLIPPVKKEKGLLNRNPLKRERKSKYSTPYYIPKNNGNHWTSERAEIGYKFECPSDTKKLRSLKEMCRAFFKGQNIERHVEMQQIDGVDYLVVCDGLKPKAQTYGVSKSGRKRYVPLSNKPKKIQPVKTPKPVFGFDKATIGHTIIIDAHRYDTFLVSKKQYCINHNIELYHNYDYNQSDKTIKITFVNKQDVIKKKSGEGIPMDVRRPNKITPTH